MGGQSWGLITLGVQANFTERKCFTLDYFMCVTVKQVRRKIFTLVITYGDYCLPGILLDTWPNPYNSSTKQELLSTPLSCGESEVWRNSDIWPMFHNREIQTQAVWFDPTLLCCPWMILWALYGHSHILLSSFQTIYFLGTSYHNGTHT